MKKLICIGLIITGAKLFGQSPTISPQVINSAGDHRQVGSSNIYITDNVGEPFTETIGPVGNNFITQGFLQPEVSSILGYTLSTAANNLSCAQKNDGDIHLSIGGDTAKITSVVYKWTPSAICPDSNCKVVTNLAAGTYSVKVIITFTNAAGTPLTDTLNSLPIVITDPGTLCKITIYSGISANGDGVNDVFTINNIEEFPNNRVMIYNRWGKLIADVKGYNNTTNIWPMLNEVNNLLATTYFYLIDLGDGSKVIKGWVELMKN